MKTYSTCSAACASLPAHTHKAGCLPYSTVDHIKHIKALIERVTYREGYKFFVGTTEGMKYPFVQVRHWRPDAFDPSCMGWGHGGKAYITQWATDSEVFQTLLGLAKAYEEHEVREFFRVDGKRVYGPHIAVSALAEVCDTLDVRD